MTYEESILTNLLGDKTDLQKLIYLRSVLNKAIDKHISMKNVFKSERRVFTTQVNSINAIEEYVKELDQFTITSEFILKTLDLEMFDN